MGFLPTLTSLTVGEVASLIGGGISILYVIMPMLWAFVLVAIIRGKQFDAVTWSSISHTLQSSSWPLLLQSDSAVGNLLGKNVRWRVFILSQIITFTSICLIAAHFVTPLPLVETMRPAFTSDDVDFAYAPDSSYYGQAMLGPQPIRRLCGWNQWLDCPDSLYGNSAVRNKYTNRTVVNSTIPQVTRDTFTKATRKSTVANLLDIQFRSYIMTQSYVVDNGDAYPLGRLEPLPRLILEEKYHLVEGLIVDTIKGGIGIRNHTLPVGLDFGATWVEDILWIRPETRCTNTNLSLHFSVSANVSYAYTGDHGFFRDDGGFSNIPASPPSPRWDLDDAQWKKVDREPNLKRNADIMAWWNNQLTAWTMNLRTSKLGNTYSTQINNYARDGSTGAIKISVVDGLYLDDLMYKRRPDLAESYRRYNLKCTGYWDDDPAEAGKPFVRCGYLYDIPSPENLDKGQSWRVDPGSQWQQNLYTCASAVVASVEQVTFSVNGTSTLDNLQVLKVETRNYTSDTMPSWGVEKVNTTKFDVWDIYRFWGLVDPDAANSPSVDVVRAPRLYLPSANRGKVPSKMWDNFAGGSIFTAVWESIYEFAASADSITSVGIPNYSGKLDYGLTLKWRQLSQAGAEGAENILNLIWTDLAAFAVAGTRSGFEDDATTAIRQAAGILGSREVQRYVRRVGYRDIRYAIPAFVAAMMCLIPFVICLCLLCFQRGAWASLNHYLNQTSMGRVATQLIQQNKPGGISLYARTGEWAPQARNIILNVPGARNDKPNLGLQTNDVSLRLLKRRTSGWTNDTETESLFSPQTPKYYQRSARQYSAGSYDRPLMEAQESLADQYRRHRTRRDRNQYSPLT